MLEAGRLGASERTLERDADRAAEWVVSRPSLSGVGVIDQRGRSPILGVAPRLQRKCECGGTCGSCLEEDEGLRVQRAPAGGEPAPAAAAPPATLPAERASGASVLVADGEPVGPGQMQRTAFMSAVRRELFAMCDVELARVGRSAEGCPYLNQWLDYYQGRPAAQIERAVQLYTGTRARDAKELISAVVARVRSAVREWAATGQLTAIPRVASTVGGILATAAGAATDLLAGRAPQTKAAAAGAVGSAAPGNPTAMLGQLGAGARLDSGVRSRMERGFGRSFADVRVHSGATAAQLSRGLAARAFTIGHDIAFAPGEYRPGTLVGDALIAHELAHTLQQSGARGNIVQPMEDAGLLEDDADLAAIGAVGSEFGLADRFEPRERSGLRLQGCGQKVKRCPKGYSWRVQATTGWGSFGCTCHWKCLPGEPATMVSTGETTISCPPDVYCDTGIRYEDVGDEYTKKGYGATMTPPPPADTYCGCFPLDMEGNKVSDVPLRPADFQMADLAPAVVDIAGAVKGKVTKTPAPGTKVDPTTGQILPVASAI